VGVCLWYSDDGGATYKTNPLHSGKGEVSIANTEMHLRRLLINGRGNSFDWFPHRTDCRSSDDGETLTPPSKSELLEDDNKACERTLKQGFNGTKFSSEPDLKKRRGVTISCSKDYGYTLGPRPLVLMETTAADTFSGQRARARNKVELHLHLLVSRLVCNLLLLGMSMNLCSTACLELGRPASCLVVLRYVDAPMKNLHKRPDNSDTRSFACAFPRNKLHAKNITPGRLHLAES
jgi:hypothetical protein